jgi:hypothetical protein
MSANTIASRVYRDKYRSARLGEVLRNAMVSESIFEVDRSDAKRIQNPYGSRPTTVVQALTGTYSPAAFTLTDDALEVTDEFIVAEHIYDFEEVLTDFDLFNNRTDQMAFSVALKLDQWVLNTITEDATGAYSTPAGGFTAANVPTILANIAASVAGYAESYRGLFLVIENTDIPGFVTSQIQNGFSFADMALRNGFMQSMMGIDIHVVRAGTFVDATVGTKTWTNSGHRLAGVKGMATYAHPRGVRWEEKGVSGKTGVEVVCYGYAGAKVWAVTASLLIDVTVTPA